jgi:hypothetical protein
MGRSTFTTKTTVCNAPALMRNLVWIIAVCGLVLGGCATSRVTNLTTTRQARNASGVYPVEFAWDTGDQTVIDGSLKPVAIVNGRDFYPMRPSLGISNRWETVIPVPASQNYVVYRFKVDYLYRAFGPAEKSSKLSQDYRLDIVDK